MLKLKLRGSNAGMIKNYKFYSGLATLNISDCKIIALGQFQIVCFQTGSRVKVKQENRVEMLYI